MIQVFVRTHCYWTVNAFIFSLWSTVSSGSSGSVLNTRGRSSQERPSIHRFHTPQVTFLTIYLWTLWGSHSCQYRGKGKPVLCMQNCARKTHSLHNEPSRKWNLATVSLSNQKVFILSETFFLIPLWLSWIHTRVLWRNTVEERQRQHTVSEEKVRAVGERIHPELLQQRRCEFPAALTQLHHPLEHESPRAMTLKYCKMCSYYGIIIACVEEIRSCI